VGLVHHACALAGGITRHERHVHHGDRDAVRLATVETALRMALAAIREHSATA
jgi:nicotinamide mononucleotide (NMN) deamidase PncC